MKTIDGIEAVACREECALDAVRGILVEGRAAGGPCHYVHMGDLNWWLFYLDRSWQQEDRLFVWVRAADRQVVGWSLLSPQAQAFDLFVHPTEVSEPLRARLCTWTEEQAGRRVRAQGGDRLRTMWVADGDRSLIVHLEGRGFGRSEESMLYLERPLTGTLPAPRLPDGFCVRSVSGEQEAVQRAAASHAAFESSRPLHRYVENYRQFMRSPVYEADRDLMIEAPDGSIAAFALFWLDRANRVGYFEPVGVHPVYRGRGLGKALLAEGLRRLAAQGMTCAGVCAESDNPAAQALYRATGFAPVRSICTYARAL